MKGNITILQTSFFATVQDKGRQRFSKYGVPQSGAMDQFSLGMANMLLGNEEDCAAIELAFQNLIIQFSHPTMIVFTGAEIEAFLGAEKVDRYRCVMVKENEILKIIANPKGGYSYVGIKGGVLSEMILKSRSFYKNITPKHFLKKNDTLEYIPAETREEHFSSISNSEMLKANLELEVFHGPEFDLLSDKEKEVLIQTNFSISDTVNRMAIVLHEKLKNTLPSILTAPVLPGTVQVTPSGTLIVLMRDCQTTGGYPRILQLSESSINHLAQKQVGDTFKFTLLKIT